jgi:sugar (pentulose or hexulose) kinase
MYLGIDFGTSGARACVIAPGGEIEDMARIDFGNLADHETAASWRETLFSLIAQIPLGMRKRLAALAIDGTSASVLACDAGGNTGFNPLHPPLRYNDARASEQAARIRQLAGDRHPAGAATSGLAKALWLQQHVSQGVAQNRLFLNQADWLAALLGGQATSDYHNALKMGIDLESGAWPDWVASLIDTRTLPRPVKPGQAISLLERTRGRELGINPDCLLRAGTTDSIAAFLAARDAAQTPQPGDAVTSLGSTLVLKLLSETRVDAAEYGIYSHWFGRQWLAGGASNAGGAVLRQYFSNAELIALSREIDPEQASGLDYYPLPAPGERFPYNDPQRPPRLEPRPQSRAEFLHGMLEGLARIEALGYARLAELGATPLQSVTSAGGGARNPTYSHIRARLLRVPVNLPATSASQDEACYGSARLARHGVALFPGETDA